MKLENLDRYKLDVQVRISAVKDDVEEVSLWELAHDVVFHVLRERDEKVPTSEDENGILLVDREWVKEKAIGIARDVLSKAITNVPDFVNKSDGEIQIMAIDEVIEYMDDAVSDLCGTFEWEIN